MNKVSGLLDMAWHGEGTSNYVPRLSTQDHNENFTKFSSFYIEDGSYLRLKNLQLGYTFKKIPGVNKLRLYIAGQNLIGKGCRSRRNAYLCKRLIETIVFYSRFQSKYFYCYHRYFS